MGTHPNLCVTGELPLVADEDFLLPGSYNGFTCCGLYNRLLQDGLRYEWWSNNSCIKFCNVCYCDTNTSLTSIPENLVPGEALLSLSSVPSALWERERSIGNPR